MENNVACYKQYVDYFKTTFSYIASPIYIEWEIDMGILIDTDSQACSSSEFSGTMESLTCAKGSFNNKKVYERKSWPKETNCYSSR